MKKFQLIFTSLLLLAAFIVKAQVQLNKQLQMTGSGTDAKITGLQSVTNTQDATNVQSIQTGVLIYADDAGSNNSFILNVSPSISSYQKGMFFNFIANQTNVGPSPATLNVNNKGAATIKKYVNQDLVGCEILTGQAVTVLYDGSNFQMTSTPSPTNPPTTANAGPNQLNIAGTTVTLAADTPINGTGLWSIVSGAGGSFSNSSSHNSNFSGSINNTYILKWTITNSCGSSSSNDTISFSCPTGSHTYNYSGSIVNLTVPVCVTSITIQAYGAQGGGGNPVFAVLPVASGGKGAYMIGTVSVNPGDVLGILVGQQGGSYSGGGGGSFVWNTTTGNTLLMVAAGGGGGGSTDNSGVSPVGGDGQITTSTSSGGGTGTASGGSGGNGGTGGADNPSWSGSGGGGGWNSNGSDGVLGGETNGGKGFSPLNGGAGGSTGNNGGVGGFGGGGGSTYPGGGGGGYNGGGGGNAWQDNTANYAGGGGGGGSYYINGTPANGSAAGANTGNGQVIISW